jgi:SAM-dependent methyltransferase
VCFVSVPACESVPFSVGETAPAWPPCTPPPDGTYVGPISERANPRHLSILASRGPGPLDVLDWGCGTGAYRLPIRDVLGHRYVGLDCEGGDADVLGDVHRLPFHAESFDHVITNSVLEHVANPFLAVREVARVLKRGGVFSGSAAFLEPHHVGSRFHLSADGIVCVLDAAGLAVEGLWPQEGWSVFDSLAGMPGPLSAPTRWVLGRLRMFERLFRPRHLHPRERGRGRWLRRKSPEDLRAELLAVAGQIDFAATKPTDASREDSTAGDS